MNNSVLRRIALLVRITPQVVSSGGQLRVSDVETQCELPLEQSSFVLMLENEPHDTFVRGQLKLLRDGTTFPVQSNVALFEMLKGLIDRAAGIEP
ncbi:MAG TPA: hypothetical protein VGL99_01220 [Chloroflexota bacterium]